MVNRRQVKRYRVKASFSDGSPLLWFLYAADPKEAMEWALMDINPESVATLVGVRVKEVEYNA
jgi:hypothetical protein